MKFVPCAGREACTDDGTHCRGCGRTHEEIARTREVTTALAELIVTTGSENADEFLEHVKAKTLKKVKAAGVL